MDLFKVFTFHKSISVKEGLRRIGVSIAAEGTYAIQNCCWMVINEEQCKNLKHYLLQESDVLLLKSRP